MSSEIVISAVDSAMESPKTEIPKLSDMVMCGDHLTVPRPETRDTRLEEREKCQVTYGRLSPSTSRTERIERTEAARVTSSEHALRALEARRQQRSLDVLRAPAHDAPAGGNRALVQAALGSFRWPPYLLVVWVAVLLLTHSLHGLVAILEKALPTIKKFCHYFYTWAEESWKSESDSRRVLPLCLALLTGLLYTVYGFLSCAHAAALWAVEPLCEGDRAVPEEEGISGTDLAK